MQSQFGYVKNCSDCDGQKPDLLPENEEVWELWCHSMTLWEPAFCGVVGLKYADVFTIADRLEVRMTPANLEKLKALEVPAIQKINERAPSGGDKDAQ